MERSFRLNVSKYQAFAPRTRLNRPVGNRSMAKELKTAQQLTDMIVTALGVQGVEVSVRKDHAYGWQPTVVACPGNSIGFQRRVEEIARRLQFQFDLRE